MPGLTLSLDELAVTLCKSVSTIKTQLVRCPEVIPPPLRIPGTRRLLWRREDVEAWMSQFPASFKPAPPVVRADLCAPKRTRGRPRKLAQEV